MPRDNHHHDESGGEEGRHPVTAHDERNGSEDDSRRTAGGGRRNRMISPVIVVPMPIVSRMMNRIGSRIWLKSESMLTNHAVRPITSHTLLMTRSTNVLTFAFGMLVACQPHQQCAQYGEQHPQDVPFRILEIIHRTHDQERREDGHVTPRPGTAVPSCAAYGCGCCRSCG